MKLFNFLENVQFIGGKTNVLIKWLIAISVAAITVAFAVGQYKVYHTNKIDDIESLAIKGMNKTEQLEKTMNDGFKQQNAKIDRIYDDGLKAFNEYRDFNNKQLRLIVNYCDKNKDLLKVMLDLNSKENAVEIKNMLKYSNNYDLVHNIINHRKKDTTNSKNSVLINPNISIYTDSKSGTEIYYVTSAPENYLDTLNLDKFEIIEKRKSKLYEGLYNFIYKNKK